MGEIRINVRLINAVDETLAQDGQLDPARVRSCEIEAVVDTGAVTSVIPLPVVQELGLRMRERRIRTAVC